MLSALRHLHTWLGRLIARIEPGRANEPPPVVVSWCHAELATAETMAGVDRILARWRAEGLPADLAEMARRLEVERRLWQGVRVNSWGGQC